MLMLSYRALPGGRYIGVLREQAYKGREIGNTIPTPSLERCLMDLDALHDARVQGCWVVAPGFDVSVDDRVGYNAGGDSGPVVYRGSPSHD